MGVGGVTVISGGNFVTVDGMKSFGMLGGTRERIRLGSGSFSCSLLAYCCWSEREEQEDKHFSLFLNVILCPPCELLAPDSFCHTSCRL